MSVYHYSLTLGQTIGGALYIVIMSVMIGGTLYAATAELPEDDDDV